MKILYDHQAFTIQNYGGISRYFFELTRQLKMFSEFSIHGSLLFSNNEYIKGNKIFPSRSFFNVLPEFQKKIETMNLLNEWKSGAIYNQGKFDLFHPTYYDTYYLNLKSKKPVVITFHDLIHEKFKRYDHRTLRHKRRVLTRADKIIAVSQSSKNDLMEYYGIPEEKVKVIHLASSIFPTTGALFEKQQKEYVLYVGNRSHYKNFLFFVKAIAPLLQQQPDLFLYCAGGGPFIKEELAVFRGLRLESRIEHHSGTDDALAGIYSNAIAFLFPSHYEGFGLPLLEAMSCGCPVGASSTSSLPEVAGDAALYFDPHDKDAILSVAETLVTKPEIRSALRQKGLVRVRDFSWRKTADQTREVYKSLA